MQNRLKYLAECSTPNLYDSCYKYIDWANTLEGNEKAEQKTYDMCADYLNGLSNTPIYVVTTLKKIFKFN